MLHHNPMVERIYLEGVFEFTSPALVGSGEGEVSDYDLLRDPDGKPFLPGSTVAGVLRHYLSGGVSEELEHPLVQRLFGQRHTEHIDSSQSRLIVYDGLLISDDSLPILTSIRDGVRLEEFKVVKEDEKYDYEVLAPGHRFLLRFEVVFYEQDPRDDLKGLLYEMIQGMVNERIRFGGKTSRGFGKGRMLETSIRVWDFDFSNPDMKERNVRAWIDFNWNLSECNGDYTAWRGEKVHWDIPGLVCSNNGALRLRIPLNIPYSLLIRQYANGSEEEDFHHLLTPKLEEEGKRVDFRPVVPGTSWSGAIRHQMNRILRELLRNSDVSEQKKMESELIASFFGDKSQKSNVRFEESTVDGSVLLLQQRVKIDRFTGGAGEGALFAERPLYGGRVDLEIEIKKIDERVEASIGLLLLAIRDLQEGFLPLGGETAIGRGILSGDVIEVKDVQEQNGKETFRLLTSEEEEFFLQKLAQCLTKARNKGEMTYETGT